MIYMVFFIAGEHVSLFFCSKCYQLKINKQKKKEEMEKKKSRISLDGFIYFILNIINDFILL